MISMRSDPAKDKNDLGPRTKAPRGMADTTNYNRDRLENSPRRKRVASKAEEMPADEIADRRDHQRKQRRRRLAEQRGVHLLGRSAGLGIAEVFRHGLIVGWGPAAG